MAININAGGFAGHTTLGSYDYFTFNKPSLDYWNAPSGSSGMTILYPYDLDDGLCFIYKKTGVDWTLLNTKSIVVGDTFFARNLYLQNASGPSKNTLCTIGMTEITGVSVPPTIENADLKSIRFNGIELDNVMLNGNEIWTAYPPDSLPNRRSLLTLKTNHISKLSRYDLPRPVAGNIYYGGYEYCTDVEGPLSTADARFQWFVSGLQDDASDNNNMIFFNACTDSLSSVGDWKKVTGIVSAGGNPNVEPNWCFRLFIVHPSIRVKVSFPFILNLTEIFGKGNEPSKEWCDKNINFGQIWHELRGYRNLLGQKPTNALFQGGIEKEGWSAEYFLLGGIKRTTDFPTLLTHPSQLFYSDPSSNAIRQTYYLWNDWQGGILTAVGGGSGGSGGARANSRNKSDLTCNSGSSGAGGTTQVIVNALRNTPTTITGGTTFSAEGGLSSSGVSNTGNNGSGGGKIGRVGNTGSSKVLSYELNNIYSLEVIPGLGGGGSGACLADRNGGTVNGTYAYKNKGDKGTARSADSGGKINAGGGGGGAQWSSENNFGQGETSQNGTTAVWSSGAGNRGNSIFNINNHYGMWADGGSGTNGGGSGGATMGAGGGAGNNASGTMGGGGGGASGGVKVTAEGSNFMAYSADDNNL